MSVALVAVAGAEGGATNTGAAGMSIGSVAASAVSTDGTFGSTGSPNKVSRTSSSGSPPNIACVVAIGVSNAGSSPVLPLRHQGTLVPSNASRTSSSTGSTFGLSALAPNRYAPSWRKRSPMRFGVVLVRIRSEPNTKASMTRAVAQTLNGALPRVFRNATETNQPKTPPANASAHSPSEG